MKILSDYSVDKVIGALGSKQQYFLSHRTPGGGT